MPERLLTGPGYLVDWHAAVERLLTINPGYDDRELALTIACTIGVHPDSALVTSALGAFGGKRASYRRPQNSACPPGKPAEANPGFGARWGLITADGSGPRRDK